MKIRIQDFGPIRDFTFDLDKDIHLLYGKNGTGKSYAVYCVFAILKQMMTGAYIFHQDNTSLLKYLKDNNPANGKGTANDSSSKLATSVVQHFIVDRIDNTFKNSYSSLSNLNNNFSRNNFRITLDSESYKLRVGLNSEGSLVVKEFSGSELTDELLQRIAAYGDKVVAEGKEMNKHVASFLMSSFYSLVLDFFFDPVSITYGFLLPASRSGLYQGLNSLAPILAELSKYKHSITRKISVPDLTEPVSDYFLAMSIIDSLEENRYLSHIIKRLENEILQGVVTYDIDDQKIFFTPQDTDMKLGMSEASSMVAELAPIVTYLKYVIKNGKNLSTILFIEEPEAHLHPEAQVKLMEILAELPKHNIKVVMTSHSNYMFNKLTNLILEKKVNPDKVATYHMVMTDQGSAVQNDMPVTDEGIEDSNFVAVSEQLYEERMRLFDEMNE